MCGASVHSLVPYRPDMVVDSCNASTLEVEAEDQEFKVILGYTKSLRLVWPIEIMSENMNKLASYVR